MKRPDVYRQFASLANNLASSRIVGLIACAIALALCLLRLDAKSLWWDESLSLLRAQSHLGVILSGRITFGGIETIDQHPPLYFLALAAVRALAGESDFALRLLSALAAVLTVAIAYALARRLFGGKVAGIAACFLAASPLLLWYAQEARMYTLATLLALTAVYAAWRASAAHNWRWGLAALLVTAVAAATHYLTVLFTLPALLSVMLGRWRGYASVAQVQRSRSRTRRWIIGLVSLVVILAGVAVALWRRLPPSSAYDQPALSLGGMLVDAINSYSLGLSVNLRQVWWLDLIFVLIWLGAGIGLALPYLRRPSSALTGARLHRLALLYLTVPIPILLVWLLTRRIPFYINSRYVMFAAPLFAIGLAYGLGAMPRLALMRWALAAVLLLSMAWSLQRYYLDPYYASKENYADAARYVMARELPGDILLVNGPESAPAFAHYYAGYLTPEGLPNMTVRPWDVGHYLSAKLVGYQRVWVVRARRNFSDPEARLLRWLDKYLLSIGTRTFESSGAQVSVSLYLVHDPVQQDAPGDITPLAQVGPAQLLFATPLAWGSPPTPVEALNQPPTINVRSGEALATRLTWRLDEPTPDFKVSLRLMRAGLVWAQRDVRPIERLPSDLWPQNAAITHTATLELPTNLPPARYELQAWVYDAESDAIWGSAAGEDASSTYLLLAQVQIEQPDPPRYAWRAPLATLMAPRWGALGQPVVLTEVGRLPDRLTPGQTLLLPLDWRWSAPLIERQVVINWQDDSGQVVAGEAQPLLGPGPLSASVTQIEGVQALYSLTAPARASDYTLHLLVFDPARQRFLSLRRGLLPSLGRDLSLGRITVAP